MIRTLIKEMAPPWVLQLWFDFREFVFLRNNRGREAVFSSIHAENIWRNPESLSGFGSTLEATSQAREGLAKLCAEHAVRSILDVPSGDYNWMSALEFDGQYIGGDIVAELVEKNQRRYGDERHRFQRVDLVKDALPKADLVLCRECLNHLSLAEANAAIDNLIAGADKFVVITHYPAVSANPDQPASFRYRSLNMTKPPFELREPDLLIDESRSEAGKCLAVWDVSRPPRRARH
jgi:hypothetical protein